MPHARKEVCTYLLNSKVNLAEFMVQIAPALVTYFIHHTHTHTH